MLTELERQKVAFLELLLVKAQGGHRWECLPDGFVTSWRDRWISIEDPAKDIKRPILIVADTKPTRAGEVPPLTILAEVAVTSTGHLLHDRLYRLLKYLRKELEQGISFERYRTDTDQVEAAAKARRRDEEELPRLLLAP